ncbi:Ribonuclease T2 precursor (RNase T2) [Clarireedia jacksonii]
MSANTTPSFPSVRKIISFAGGLLSQMPLNSNPSSFSSVDATSRPYEPFKNAHSCPSDAPVSCHNSTAAPDSCCFIYPGGQLLQTQFWDYSPAIGPKDSWTLHGLWPDLCDGSYPTYCRETAQYHNITSVLTAASQTDLLSYMSEYWLPNRGTAENFWEHEYNKHATCINTLAPSCYGEGYQTGDEVVDFFTRAVELFKTLDTYKALASAGIVPSYTARYTEEQIQDALREVTGSEVVLGCSYGRLNQAWYSFNMKGSLQLGEFVATEPAGKGGRGSCPKRGIKYLPKA